MTLKNLYNLAKNEIEDIFEVQIICEEFLGFSRKDVILYPEKEIEDTEKFFNAINRRKMGEPLQYILGHWYFDQLDLVLNSEVLIPREDTLVLCDSAKNYIKNNHMTGIDLCSGTGAVALSVANACENSKIFALELYEKPLQCLKKNVEKYGDNRVEVFSGDVFKDFTKFKDLDFIVSNPPYIKTEVIPTLQKEVLKEPITALDGGEYGLDFYEFILENWKKCLKPNGFISFEIGEDQGADLINLFKIHGFKNIELKYDFNGLPRVVCGNLI